MAVVEIAGEVVNDKENMVALKKEPFVTFYKLNEGKATPKAKFLVNAKKLNSDAMIAWEEIELMYYDTCSSCHAAHKSKEHLMGEWEAYILAMQTFAKINDDEKDRILRFMQAFVKDGIVKE
ncbi:hypothetical protein [Campylobacter californiensis]|nr:hypothetical protein [Campylobacter sp. RM13119]